MIERFGKQRDFFLARALDDARKWCVPPESYVDTKKHSDQYWLRLFSSASEPVTDRDAHDFLISFQLETRFTKWNEVALAKRINTFRGQEIADLPAEIGVLAEELRGFLKSGKGLQTSGASKIAFFAKPRCDVYIWDQHARRSARFRDWRRASGGSNPRQFSSPYVAHGVHDYASFKGSCDVALKEELMRHDFNGAVERFRSYVRRVGGPMADNKLLRDSSFIERRFLDKLMFWEGKYVEGLKASLKPPERSAAD